MVTGSMTTAEPLVSPRRRKSTDAPRALAIFSKLSDPMFLLLFSISLRKLLLMPAFSASWS